MISRHGSAEAFARGRARDCPLGASQSQCPCVMAFQDVEAQNRPGNLRRRMPQKGDRVVNKAAERSPAFNPRPRNTLIASPSPWTSGGMELSPLTVSKGDNVSDEEAA